MSRVLPILFNGDMVRAILDGRKTVTRRVIKPCNAKKARDNEYCQDNGLWIDPSIDNGDHEDHIKDYSISPCWISWSYYIWKYAPYQPGDILYVRETWTRLDCCSCEGDLLSGECCLIPDENEGCYVYRANHVIYGDAKWYPSIHMPKAAARIWLKVTDVRVERLQDITEEQAKAEDNRGFIHSPDNEYDRIHSAKEHFSQIWDSTIKKSDLARYGWEANPWVWVIEFERRGKPQEEDG